MKGCYCAIRDNRELSESDRIEIDAFQRVLSITAWREKELGEKHIRAVSEACLEVYGDKWGEGDKHRPISTGKDKTE